MLSKLMKALNSDCPLAPDRVTMVGVSGGADSLSLLHALKSLGYSVIACHLDHALRDESAEDTNALRSITDSLQIPLSSARQDVYQYAREQRLSIEEAAREVRYRFLFQQAHLHQAQAIAVGHTADDQVETVLMHLLRGSGLAGLRGMRTHALPNPWSDTIPLIRPLLGVWRSETHAYCQEHALTPIFDRSNLDTTFYRNRLRLELIPYLEQNFNPGIRNLLWKMADNLNEEYKTLSALNEQAWEICLLEKGKGYIIFSLPEWNKQTLGTRRNLVRLAAISLQPDIRDIDYNSVERAI